MRELIEKQNIYIAQPPLYKIKRGKNEKYIKNEAEFTQRNHAPGHREPRGGIRTQWHRPQSHVLEGGELRAFLMNLDDFQQISHKLERRLRESRVIDALSNAELAIDTKNDFSASENLEKLGTELKKTGVESAIEFEEEHSVFSLTYHDSTNGLRRIGIELSQQPEYRKFRLLSKQIAKSNQPPFSVVKNEHRDSIPNWRDLLEHIKTEGKRDASVQRYKGLGEMNAEQLADTTMDPDKRTLLSVRLEDVVATDLIFTTLMGEDVENRRRFIEENALDVKNLDV